MIFEKFPLKRVHNKRASILRYRPINIIYRTITLFSHSPTNIPKKDVELRWLLLPMGEMGVNISKEICYHLLQWCICKKDLEAGEIVYYLITSRGLDSNSFLGTHVIRMFASFGRLKEANQVFAGVARPSVYAWSAIVLAHAMCSQSNQALHLYHDMNKAGPRPDSHTFVATLKACAVEHDLKIGMHVHAHIAECGLESVDHIGSSLMGLYIHGESLDDARSVFDGLVNPSVVLWSVMMYGYAQQEYFVDVFCLYQQMQLKGVEPNQVTYICILKACASLEAITKGMQIHCLIIKAGVEIQAFAGSSLVDMYAKCGMLRDAHETFEGLRKQDVVEWNAIIAGKAQYAYVQEVLQLHDRMQQHGVQSNQITLTCILKACASTTTLGKGKQVHAHVIGRRLEADLFISNALLNLYARCGDIGNLCQVFKKLDKRNAVTWAVVIAGCAEHGDEKRAFCFFEHMKQEGTLPNSATFLSILRACSAITDLKVMHSYIIEEGFESDAAVASNLIRRYGECKSLPNAHKVFEHLQEHDVVSWNALITAYAQHGHVERTFWLFFKMQGAGMRPDNVTFNSMISALARDGVVSEALQLFQQMQLHDVEPNAKVFSCVIKVCSKLATPQVGKLIHGQVVERGLEVDVSVGEALSYMYLLYGALEDAQQVFDRLEHRGVGIWNTMISGYMQIGHDMDISSFIEEMQAGTLEATAGALITSFQEFPTHRHIVKVLELYCDMNQEGISPDQATFVYILKACSLMTVLDHGRQIYAHIVEAGLDQDLLIGNILIHLYAEFNSFEDAYQVFNKLHKRNVVTFNTLFAACAQHNNLKLVLDCFQAMQQQGVKADGATFLSLFSACSRIGKADEALVYFKTMREDYGIDPTYAHYSCMVDLIGRKGYLREGEDLLQTMPFRPSTVGLTSLLNHCRVHGSLNLVGQGIRWLTVKESKDAEP